jgi:putative Holliday junction resolvase
MRTLAIDLGTKRVGLALSDQGARFATPHGVLQVASPEQAIESILPIIKKEGIQRLAVGLPLNMDDSVGKAAKRTIQWGNELAKQSGIPVIFIDERLSSFAAEQSLTERRKGGERLTRQDKKERIDALAAAKFLQDFLDGKLAAIDVTLFS